MPRAAKSASPSRTMTIWLDPEDAQAVARIHDLMNILSETVAKTPKTGHVAAFVAHRGPHHKRALRNLARC